MAKNSRSKRIVYLHKSIHFISFSFSFHDIFFLLFFTGPAGPPGEKGERGAQGKLKHVRYKASTNNID